MGSRSRTATQLDKHARFVAVVARALLRPITDFKPLPVRPAYRRAHGTSARNENENPYFHVDQAGA
jgi:hypothetical protein